MAGRICRFGHGKIPGRLEADECSYFVLMESSVDERDVSFRRRPRCRLDSTVAAFELQRASRRCDGPASVSSRNSATLERKQNPTACCVFAGSETHGSCRVQKTRGADRRGRVSVANGCGRYHRRRRVRSCRSRKCRSGDRNPGSPPRHHRGLHRYPDAGFHGWVEARPGGQGALAADQDRRNLRPRQCG